MGGGSHLLTAAKSSRDRMSETGFDGLVLGSMAAYRPRSLGASPNDNGNGMRVQVQCHAGRKADERPIRFQLGERHFMVEEILDQWYGPDDEFFKVRADDGNLYILRHHPLEDEWSLEFFRQTAK